MIGSSDGEKGNHSVVDGFPDVFPSVYAVSTHYCLEKGGVFVFQGRVYLAGNRRSHGVTNDINVGTIVLDCGFQKATNLKIPYSIGTLEGSLHF